MPKGGLRENLQYLKAEIVRIQPLDWVGLVNVNVRAWGVVFNGEWPIADSRSPECATQAPRSFTSAAIFIIVICSSEGGSRVKTTPERSKKSVDASGLKLSRAAGVTLQQADDGRVALGSFDELL